GGARLAGPGAVGRVPADRSRLARGFRRRARPENRERGEGMSDKTDRPLRVASDADRIFAEKRQIADFDFGRETATVFDDMLSRSVPYYDEIQRMSAELVADFAADGTSIYDLGCSTGESFLNIERVLPPDVTVRYVGIDSSQEMLDIARGKL